jgi:hypothetical protein
MRCKNCKKELKTDFEMNYVHLNGLYHCGYISGIAFPLISTAELDDLKYIRNKKLKRIL